MKINILFFLLLIGCNGQLDPFPADYIFVANPDTLTCSKHEIIKKDPVTVDDGVEIPWSECPHTFGFASEDVGPVMNWIRNSQEEAKKRCR